MRHIVRFSLVLVLTALAAWAPVLTLPAMAACKPTLSPWDASYYQLPSGRRGVAYTTSITASGGRRQYFWQFVGGDVPPGLTYSPHGAGGSTFTISGTPST